MSIRRFLLAGLLGILLLSFVVIFLFNRYQAFVEVGELYDAQLAQSSRILQGFLNRPADEIDFDHINTALLAATENYSNDDTHDNDNMRNDGGHKYEHKFAIQIWDKSTNLLVKSPSAPLYAIADFKDGYSIKKIGDFNWHVFTQHLPSNGYWVVIAERADIREEIIEKLTYSSLVGPLAGMVFLAFGVILVVTKGLQPLIDLSQQIRERNIDKLEPLVLEKAPKELIPLGQAVNLLMEQVSQDVERERRFLGDIAHELRTPLAAMKLNAQNGLYSKDIYSVQNFLIKIVRGVDRSIRLIEQLLTLARLDPRALGEPETCVLGDIAQEVINALSPQQQSGVHIHVEESLFNTQLNAYPDLLSVMLRNLIENASRYSPEGGKISLAAEQTANNIIFALTDQGPGVSEQQLHSLGKRFFRERPADRMGSGLGLSIVARIAELHQAQVSFSNAVPQGLVVKILFPLANANGDS
ncbi:MAG TPA: ATP-binding protein [Cellvibrio sp.]|nr:ATP-binding protein [Cellvibrio sp.]